MILFLLPVLALASPKTFTPGAAVELAVGESAENRASATSPANDIVSTITLVKSAGAEAEFAFSQTDHCAKGQGPFRKRPACPNGTVTESKNFSLHAGKSLHVSLLGTSLTFTLREAWEGKATVEIVTPSAKILSNALQKRGDVLLIGNATGVPSVEVSVSAGARGTDFAKSVTTPVIGDYWVIPFGDLPPGQYSVMVSDGAGKDSLAQGHLTVR